MFQSLHILVRDRVEQLRTQRGGAGYAFATQPYARELDDLRSRAELTDAITRRMLTMTPGERRQLDVLMKWQLSGR